MSNLQGIQKQKSHFMKQIGRGCITPQGPLAFIEAKFNMRFSLAIYTLAKPFKNISSNTIWLQKGPKECISKKEV